jgi:hypothetical protein
MNDKCRITGEPLVECVALGDQYITDFVQPGSSQDHIRAPLRLGIAPKTGAAQLFDTVDPKQMYDRYWYESGINASMREHLYSIADQAQEFVSLNRNDVVLDIAANDGTLLSRYPEHVTRLGIDPSSVARSSAAYGGKIQLVNDFFSQKSYESATSQKAKIITVIAMFYDLSDPASFLADVRNIIAEDGVLVIQLSYTPLMLAQREFGNICHEHVFYHTLHSLRTLLTEAGFSLVDAQLNDTNGGSLRVYATPLERPGKLKCPLHWLSIGTARLNSLIEYENNLELDTPIPYLKFASEIEELKNQTVTWLEEQRERKKLVVGYGASTKANVLLQYYGITPELLPCIAEANQNKWGLSTIGSEIPIISEAEMRKMRPDYLLALPWFFISYFLKREADLLATGTRFVMPQPELTVIDNIADPVPELAAA